MLGEAVRRIEDPRVLRGGARYVDDLEVPDGTVHVAIVRTPVPHAVIGEIDASEAAGMPGVVEVVLAGDLGRGGDAHPHPTWHPPSASLRAAIGLDVRPRRCACWHATACATPGSRSPPSSRPIRTAPPTPRRL